MQKLSLNKETLRRLGTESLAAIAAGVPGPGYTDGCVPTDNTTDGCTVDDHPTQTGNTKPTSIRTTGP